MDIEPTPTTVQNFNHIWRTWLDKIGQKLTGPTQVKSYTVATVPDATIYTNTEYVGLIYVSDEAGGGTLAFSDGTNWRRVQDRTIVS